MRREWHGAWIALVACATLAAAMPTAGLGQEGAQAPGERVRGYVPPPTNLKFVDGHWTPYDPPTPPEGVQVRVVEKGDTLWDLAATYYGDPYLWPVIWDANRYVTYSHWIYPGDPLVIPPAPTVVGEQGPEQAPVEEQVVEQVEPERPAPEVPFGGAEEKPVERPRTRPTLVPAVEAQEMLCASQLWERFDPTPLTVAGREEPKKQLQGPGDIVFLSAGQDLGIEPGSEFVAIRAEGTVSSPVTGKPVAVFVRRMARLRVIAVQSQSATAEIVSGCDPVEVGDYLVPYREMPIPMIERIPLRKLATEYPGRLNGTVIAMSDPQQTIAAAGDTVGIDLGQAAGLTAGDRVLFWRPGELPEEPRRVVAQGVVISTQGGGSTVKVIESHSEIRIGDSAEVL
ncbi:MAG: LysM domain-containing protein [Acidobacteriota bacterium]